MTDEEDKIIGALYATIRHGARWLTNLWVDGKERGKGIATRLLMEGVSRYQHEDLYLTVMSYSDRRMDDTALTAWYGRFGFLPVPGAPGVMRRPAGPLHYGEAK